MIERKFLSQSILTAVLALTLTACGFHLRGNIPLPDGIKNMYIQAPTGSFKDELEILLAGAGAQLMSNKGGADVVLNVTRAKTKRTVGTLDERGKANSYNLVFTVKYSLDDPEGNAIRSNALSEVRRYNFNPEFVVESESEEADLQEDMEEAIGLRIVRQLSSVTDYPPVAGQSTE